VILGIGTDLESIARIEGLWQRAGTRFLQRIYTAAEVEYCLSLAAPAPSLAARFCAKEAVMKCLGSGWADGVRFCDIEVVRAASGAVAVVLHGRAAERAAARGIARVHLSLSHGDGQALAFAVAEGGSAG
jgi:holo-[acyl-carrier protein] synthase